MSKQLKSCIITLFSFLLLLPANVCAQELLGRKESSNAKVQKLDPTTNKRVEVDASEYLKPLSANEHFVISSGVKYKKPKSMLKAEASDVTLYGSVIYSADISSVKKLGIYSFPASSGTSITSVKLGKALRANGGGAYVNGMYHMVYYLDESVGISDPYYYVYNTKDEWSKENFIENEDLGSAATSMTYDAITNNIYAVSFTDDTRKGDLWLSTLNIETAKMMHIAVIEPMAFIAAAPDGQLYGVRYSDGAFCKINKKTAELTSIGLTGVMPKYLQSGTFDPNTGRLYWSAMTTEGASALFEINVATGAASLISDMPGKEEVVGLFIPTEDAKGGSPAAISDLTAQVNGNSCNVHFTVPTKTVDGDALSGTLSMKIYVNGTLKEDTTVAAGSEFSATYDALEDGKNYVKVVLSNEVGEGDINGVDIWVGPDVPLPVSNLVLSSNGDTKAIISWSPADKGINNGTLQPSMVKYKVEATYTRGSEKTNVVLCEDLQDTTYSYTVVGPDEDDVLMTVKVTPSTAAGTGESLVSNTHMFFNPKEVPYTENFETIAVLNNLVVYDTNNDGSIWTYDKSRHAMQYKFNNKNNADDWFYIPTLKLEKGKTYKLNFDTECENEDFIEKLEVAYTKDIYR